MTLYQEILVHLLENQQIEVRIPALEPDVPKPALVVPRTIRGGGICVSK